MRTDGFVLGVNDGPRPGSGARGADVDCDESGRLAEVADGEGAA